MIRHFVFAALALCTALCSACSAGDHTAPPMLNAGDSPLLPAPTGESEVCANHEEGCPCDQPGEVTDCGRIKRVAGDYVWCSTGTQTCDQYGAWGKCTGDQLATPPAGE